MTTLMVFVCRSIMFENVWNAKSVFSTFLFLNRFQLWLQILGGYDWGNLWDIWFGDCRRLSFFMFVTSQWSIPGVCTVKLRTTYYRSSSNQPRRPWTYIFFPFLWEIVTWNPTRTSAERNQRIAPVSFNFLILGCVWGNYAPNTFWRRIISLPRRAFAIEKLKFHRHLCLFCTRTAFRMSSIVQWQHHRIKAWDTQKQGATPQEKLF